MIEFSLSSLKPYFIRALHEWCTDHGFTPYISVHVDESVLVPFEYVRNGEVVLNVSYDATSSLSMKNDSVAFKARFGGSPKDIWIPIENVLAIYAKENGQGMAFPRIEKSAFTDESRLPKHVELGEKANAQSDSPKPKLTRIK